MCAATCSCVVLALEAAAPRAVLADTILVTGTNSPADAATINAAIAHSPEGSEIVLCGKFLISQTIRLLGRRSYRGDSRVGTVLRQADGANLPALLASAEYLDDTSWTGTPIAVRHLTLDGNRDNNPQAPTVGLMLRSWLTTVEHLHIANLGGDGLRITSLGSGGTGLRTTQVNGRVADCFIENSGRHGVCVEDPGNAVTDWTLCDTWIAGSGADGIHLENAAGWMVERNHIYGVPHHAIYADRLFGTSICDNYIEGFGETDERGEWCGILGLVQGGAASTIAHNRIFNFAGERQPDSVYRYLALTVRYGTGVVVVVGNAIRGAATPRGVGLHYTASEGRSLRVISAGNAVEDVDTAQSTSAGVTVLPGL